MSNTLKVISCWECNGNGCKYCNGDGTLQVQVIKPGKQRKSDSIQQEPPRKTDWGRIYG